MTAMNAKRRICTALLVLLTLPAAQGQVAAVPDTAALRRPFGAEDAAAFAEPTSINYPQTWFHLIGGNVSAEGITEDFEAIARTGISGVQLFPGQFGGPWPGVDPQISCHGVGQYVDILCHCQCVAFLSSKSSSVMVAAAICSEKIPAPAGPLAAAPAPTPDNPAATAFCIIVQ